MEKTMQTDRIIGISLLIVGVALLIAGVNASESVSSEFSKLFQGVPSDKAIWLMLGGALVAAIGLAKSLRGRPAQA
jgi:drug/metabolite transporter (DMT)-like permease